MKLKKWLSYKFREKITFVNVIFVIAITIAICVLFHYKTKDIQLKIAVGGFGPQDYVNQKLHPRNFEKNWTGSIMAYDHSMPMKAYYWLAKHYAISSTTSMYPFMFLQILFFVVSVAVLAHTLFENVYVTFLSVVIVSVSNLAGLNLSRFGFYGSYLGVPLYYGYAVALSLLGIAYSLKNKHIQSFVFVALSAYCHLTIGLFAFLFISAYLLLKPQLLRDKAFLAGLCVFSVLIAPHVILLLSNAAISSGGVPVEQWVKATKIFGYHWYPFTMKMFSKYAYMEFFPFVLSCLYFFAALRYQYSGDERLKKVLAGSGACLVASVIGIVLSDLYPIPFLIKIAPQRATSLITVFAVIYTVHYLCKKIESRNFTTVSIAVYTLLVLIFSSPGIAVLPLLVLVGLDIRDGSLGCFRLNPDKTLARASCLVAGLLVLLLSMLAIARNNLSAGILHSIANSLSTYLWSPLQCLDPFSRFDLLMRGGTFKSGASLLALIVCSVLLAGCVRYCGFLDGKHWKRVILVIFVCLPLPAVWALESDTYQRWYSRHGRVASAYLDVQLWAKNNTAHDALFMPDPSHSYGWRDFSERSSFGSLREWGYCAIVYDADYEIYKEGLKRMKEFGIDLDEVTEEEIRDPERFVYAEKLTTDIRSAYYGMSADRLEELRKKYSIDFFVANKKFLVPAQEVKWFERFHIVYQNEHFIVFAPGSQDADFRSIFPEWNGPDIISAQKLSAVAPPLGLQGIRGEFRFSRIPSDEGDVIRIFPVEKPERGELTVQFGYMSGDNGAIDITLQSGQFPIVALFARLSEGSEGTIELFIQDKTSDWERKSTWLAKDSWDWYFVSKRIRNDPELVCYGISWNPHNLDEWLEIRDVRIFVGE